MDPPPDPPEDQCYTFGTESLLEKSDHVKYYITMNASSSPDPPEDQLYTFHAEYLSEKDDDDRYDVAVTLSSFGEHESPEYVYNDVPTYTQPSPSHSSSLGRKISTNMSTKSSDEGSFGS
eukprot:14288206-Ditylum_brightwellii.AAC.1